MRLYTCTGAPSPRRVTALLAEKEMEIEQVEVDLRAGEHMQAPFCLKNPMRTVPVLELDDGSCIWETGAIRGYLEEIQPEPRLLGADAKQRARVAMWDYWVEFHGLMPVMNAFRNAAPGFEDRALPGPRPVPQIAELAERGRRRYGEFLEDLDAQLGDSAHVAGDAFSVADIDARVTIDFARRAIKIDPPAELENLARWNSALDQRAAFRE